MNRVAVVMKNCFGIAELSHTFDFRADKPNGRAFAIYAPNGVMKSSFAKALDCYSKGEEPKEERYGRPASLQIIADGVKIPNDAIFVLKADIDILTESRGATDVLVSPEHKARYDELISELEGSRSQLLSELNKVSGVKKTDLEERIVMDWGTNGFGECVVEILTKEADDDLSDLQYSIVFDPKSIEVIDSPEFQRGARDFSARYLELFETAGTVYKRGGFNPHAAETVFDSMAKHHYFAAGHRVQFEGEAEVMDEAAVVARLRALNESIEGDSNLKALKRKLTKNAQSQALIGLMEQLSPHQLDVLIERLKPETRAEFRRELWVNHMQACPSARSFAERYKRHRAELATIENEAAGSVDRWRAAVELYNERFIGLPFELAVENQAAAVIGQEPARLKFVFKDGHDAVEQTRSEIKTLSQGEMRALYLLGFIFEVEHRKALGITTLFVVDDPADSFDYKNKIAILQYLEDLTLVGNFRSVVLTHNFDFYRSMSRFVHYEHCLAADREESQEDGTTRILLVRANGINDYFNLEIKGQVGASDRSLCAAIPFVRNILEFMRGTTDEDYVMLCDMLHWHESSPKKTVGDFLSVFNGLFNKALDASRTDSIIQVIALEASKVCDSIRRPGFNLEDKLLLSIAIRLEAERYLIEKCPECRELAVQSAKSWNNLRNMVTKYQSLLGDGPTTRLLRQVAMTVNSNIHLNAFMYEPIVDLGIEHLVALYRNLKGLSAELS